MIFVIKMIDYDFVFEHNAIIRAKVINLKQNGNTT